MCLKCVCVPVYLPNTCFLSLSYVFCMYVSPCMFFALLQKCNRSSTFHSFHPSQGSFSGSDVEVEESLSESETSEGGEEEQEPEGSVEEDGLSSTVKLLKRRKKMLEKRHRQQKRLHVRGGDGGRLSVSQSVS